MCAIERFARVAAVWVLTAPGWVPPASADPQRLLQAIGAKSPPPTRADIRPALRDPFALRQAAVTVPPLPPVEMLPVVVAPIQPVAPPPPMLTFSGRMRAPDGHWVLVAQMGEAAVPVTLVEGKELANGYRVERISDRVVELLNPQTQHLLQLAVPAAPRFETW